MSIPYTIITQNAPPGTTHHRKTVCYSRATIRRPVSTEEIAGKISRRSTLSMADIQGVLYAVAEILEEELSEGNQVILNGIGSFRISASGRAVEEGSRITPPPEDPRLHFRPSGTLRKSLGSFTFKPQGN